MFTKLRRIFLFEKSCRFCGKRLPRKLKSKFCSTECWDRFEYMKVY